ncbi:Uncharacterised protein [Rothia dentocariosa]|nr:Uncharacterised protein [Rothia dentocariosa]
MRHSVFTRILPYVQIYVWVYSRPSMVHTAVCYMCWGGLAAILSLLYAVVTGEQVLCRLRDRNVQALALREVQGNRQGLASDQFLVGAQSLQGVLRGTHR